MSQETSSTTSYQAAVVPTRVRLLTQAVAHHAGATGLTWRGSAELTALSAPTLEALGNTAAALGPVPLAGALARHSSLARATVADALVRTACPQLMARADADLAAGQRLAELGRTDEAVAHARRADDAVRQALAETAVSVRPEERMVTAAAAARALHKMGCDVQVDEGQRTTALWATRGDVRIAVVVEDGGIVHTDIAGCEGGVCTPVGEELARGIEREGVVLDRRRTSTHGDEEGGTRIDRAARIVVDRNWARALVEQEERGVPSGHDHAGRAGAARQRVGTED